MKLTVLFLLASSLFGGIAFASPATIAKRDSLNIPHFLSQMPSEQSLIPYLIPNTDRYTCKDLDKPINCNMYRTHCLFLQSHPYKIDVKNTVTKWCGRNGDTFIFSDGARVVITSENGDTVNIYFGADQSTIRRSRDHPWINCRFRDDTMVCDSYPSVCRLELTWLFLFTGLDPGRQVADQIQAQSRCRVRPLLIEKVDEPAVPKELFFPTPLIEKQ
ncbi:hypothetical protein FA10DRAFT_39732 [Acaromyces ingoldii]|uniref:Uncharacterized protein n=1 Tax=Acaromyces ingoldii TaxID=215250 RepID=A0A316YZ47_9BASI|nr:hypothetical protein FA10DRAFT_39732 [Acaromyces ingoldii]PWN94034.1 hypothetical protein FA10DRAFT_39732 [Acaromyces ingoldii]